MYKLTVFIPDEALEQVKSALFAAGAGSIGDYEQCCWQVQGTGQFMPLAGSAPHIGKQDSLETVNEWRVEMVIDDAFITAAVIALKEAHPYETPAYDVIKVLDF
ncbi:Bsu YqfO NIF3/CutA domain [Psychrobacter nivimaris]|uniref:Bsu YqfO NIF3/CutA domain n=1 Tax=Psychrobacter nivimaris TaxID=281738 RepID=A0A6N7BWY1_9GAMM|nr:NGG1p interacting factor NIF3 [Psychrobacter nivimaris]KAF0568185.1 Bsu YqfO NIF3/CutA domain [Psychrobacter nivimaris]|tara:strand:- start:1419 stop:1730 length:312 start_codon:yes stop_codon:yes gene_type:complete